MPSNARLMSRDVVRTAGTTITASSTAAAMAASRLKVDRKGEAWRSAPGVTTASLTVVLPVAEPIGLVALPFSNLTAAAQMRTRTRLDASAPLNFTLPYQYDSGNVNALAAAPEAPLGWGTAPQGVNSFALGGAACARRWIPTRPSARVIQIDITDPTNPAGYLEASRLIAGDYFEFEVNPDEGMGLIPDDTHDQGRSGAGDLTVQLGLSFRRLELSLNDFSQAERARIWSYLVSGGRALPAFLSIFPDATDGKLEAAHQMWCYLTSTDPVTARAAIRYGASLKFAEA